MMGISYPLGCFSSSLSTVRSQYSKTRCSFFLRRKTSIKLTRFGCFNCWKEEEKKDRQSGDKEETRKKKHLPIYLEHPYFSEGDLFDERVLLRLDKLLDGHNLARLAIAALVDDAVRAFAHPADLLVALHEVRRRRPRPEHRKQRLKSLNLSLSDDGQWIEDGHRPTHKTHTLQTTSFFFRSTDQLPERRRIKLESATHAVERPYRYNLTCAELAPLRCVCTGACVNIRVRVCSAQ